MITRRPPIDGARQNAAPLNCAISADIKSNSVTDDRASNRDRIRHLSVPRASVLRNFLQYVIAFYSRTPEAASDVISSRLMRLTVPDKRVKFHDPRLNHSPEI